MTPIDLMSGEDVISGIPPEELFATVVSGGIEFKATNNDETIDLFGEQMPRFIDSLGPFASMVTCTVSEVGESLVVHVLPREDK